MSQNQTDIEILKENYSQEDNGVTFSNCFKKKKAHCTRILSPIKYFL